MNFQLKCSECGCLYWRCGEEDPDTNGVEITDRRGDGCPECDGDDYAIVGYDDPAEDDW